VLPEHWIESLFSKMAYTYGVKFADQWRGIDGRGVKLHWAEALTVLSREELSAGVHKLSTRDWPPTLPEFLKLCRPALDPQAAYYEALEQGMRRQRGEPEAWSLPAIFWAWSAIGAHDFNQLGYAMLKPRWERALAAELAKSDPEPIPARAIALPAPGQTRTAEAEARSMLQAYGMQLAQYGKAPAGRGTGWAHKIIERSRSGEVMSIAAIEAAEAVLGISRREAACR
jgi:hypothetical protein